MGSEWATSVAFWNEHFLELKRLWDVEGWPANRIAAYFGVTRNAVLGVVRRRGLSDRPPAIIRKPKGAPAAAEPAEQHRMEKIDGRTMGWRKRARRPVYFGPREEIPAQLEPLLRDPIRQEDIVRGECRWIVADEKAGRDALMCGAPQMSGKSWCERHAERACEKPPAMPQAQARVEAA